MTRMKLRRHPQKSHRARRTLLAVGALGAAAEGVRRWRHRHQPEQPEH
jgi:hypothetical protein